MYFTESTPNKLQNLSVKSKNQEIYFLKSSLNQVNIPAKAEMVLLNKAAIKFGASHCERQELRCQRVPG